MMQNLSETPWKTLSTKSVYRNKWIAVREDLVDRKSTRLNSSHIQKSRMPSSA